MVLHDALVSPEVLALASGALEPVGKRAGGVRTPQLRINARLIALARAGRRVVRLKGGDPLLFGRGGEEALALAAAASRSASYPASAPASAAPPRPAIPLTHRTLARSVAFATGHDADGHLPPDLDVRADVLVFFMPLRQAGAIAAHLIAAGRAPDEAIAFISDATTRASRCGWRPSRPRQRRRRTCPRARRRCWSWVRCWRCTRCSRRCSRPSR